MESERPGRERWSVPRHYRHTMVEAARRVRHEPSFAEERLWEAIRRKSLNDVRLGRQQPIDPFVVDFLAASHRLIVEVDGPHHADRVREDRIRQDMFESLDFRFLRLPSDLVERDLPRALHLVEFDLQSPTPDHTASPPS